MKRFGYWNSLDDGFLSPKDFIIKGWNISDRLKVINYLRSGATALEYTGFTYCLLGCKSNYGLENTELYDGVWTWPQSLVHYVECHSLKPSDEFLHHIKQNNYIIPFPIQRYK